MSNKFTLKEFIEATKEGMEAGPFTRQFLVFFIFPILHLLVFGVNAGSIFAAAVMTGLIILLNMLNVLAGINKLYTKTLEEINENLRNHR